MFVKLFTDKVSLISSQHGTDMCALDEPQDGCNIELYVKPEEIKKIDDELGFYRYWINKEGN